MRPPRIPPHFKQRPFLSTWGLNLASVALNTEFAWWNATAGGPDWVLLAHCVGLAVSLWTTARVGKWAWDDWWDWQRFRELMMKIETVVAKLSTGEPATLGAYYDRTVALLGEDSKAVTFLACKIESAPRGRDEVVIADERQMMLVLVGIHLDNSIPPENNNGRPETG